jgi:hypothetical protein
MAEEGRIQVNQKSQQIKPVSGFINIATVKKN